MLSKNNYQEKAKLMREQAKKEHFGIRKLAVGAVSVLLGFSFLMGNNSEAVKADTVGDANQSQNVQKSSDKVAPTDKDKDPKLNTFSGLSSFLRTDPNNENSSVNDNAEQTPDAEPADADQNTVDAGQTNVVNNAEQDSAPEAAPVDPKQAAKLDTAAQGLQDEIDKAQAAVNSADFTNADTAKKTALTTAISAGQALLSKYQTQLLPTDADTNADSDLEENSVPVTVDELNAANEQIKQALTAVVGEITPKYGNTWTDGECQLVYDAANSTLHVKAGENGNHLSGGYNKSFYSIVNGDNYQIEKLVFDDTVVLATDSSYKFANFVNLKEIVGLDKVDTSQVTNMNHMFYFDRINYDSALTNLDLSNFDTSNVTDMSHMFEGDGALTGLDLSNFNTTKVTNMSHMFYDDYSLSSLDLHNFDTSKVTDMSFMFYEARRLISLDLHNFDTSNVTNMSGMFDGSFSLTSLNLNSFNTSNVTNMSQMFYGVDDLKDLDLSNFDTSNVKDMSFMFYGDSLLKSLNLGSFDTSNVTNMYGMFSGDRSLTSLDVGNFDTSQVTNMSNMFYEDYGLSSLDLHNFDTSKVTNMSYMFANDVKYSNHNSSLTSLDLSSFDTSNVKDMSHMFEGVNTLTSLDLRNFDTSKVTNMSYMFACNTGTHQKSSLTSLDLSSFDTSNVTNMSHMFEDVAALPSLDLHNFDTSKVTNMSYMFAVNYYYTVSSALENLNVSSFDTSNVTNMSYMFENNTSLVNLNVSNFDTSNVTNMSHMFSGDSALTNLNLGDKFDTGSVTDMSYMFSTDSSLTSLDLSNFDTSNVTKMTNMFSGDSSLTSLDVDNFDTSNVTNMYGMFSGDSALTNLNLGDKFDTGSVTNMSYMFYNDSVLTSLALSNFDTSNVTNMSWMFSNDKALTSLALSNFDTSNVTDMTHMFYGDSALTSLDLSNFDTISIGYDNVFNKYKTDDIFRNTGNPNRFVLKLGKNTKLYGDSNVGLDKGYIREVGNGTEDNPQGAVLTNTELEKLYDKDIGTLPEKTYIMSRSSDATTYNPVASQLTVHNNQVSAGNPDKLLDFGNGLTVSGLKEKTDGFAPANKTIMDIKWLPNKVMTTDGLDDGGVISDASGKLRYDADEVANSSGNAVIEVNYGDGSTDDVPVTINVVGAEGRTQTVTSGEEITRPASDFITEASKSAIASFNPQYSFVRNSAGDPLADQATKPTLNFADGTNQSLYVKVEYYEDADHTESTGSEIITVPVTVKSQADQYGSDLVISDINAHVNETSDVLNNALDSEIKADNPGKPISSVKYGDSNPDVSHQNTSTVSVTVKFNDNSAVTEEVTFNVVGATGPVNPINATSDEVISKSASDLITNKESLSGFNPQYSFVNADDTPLANHAQKPTLTWTPGQDLQNIYVKVNYYKNADHTISDGSEIITVPVTVDPVQQNVTVHHYLQTPEGDPTTTTVPGMHDTEATGNVHGKVTVGADGRDQHAPSGYRLQSGDQTSPVITAAGGQSVTFYYMANEQSNITVNYVDVAHDTEVLKTENPTGHTDETLKYADESAAAKLPAGYHLASGNELGNHIQATDKTWENGVDKTMTIYVVGKETTSANNLTVNYYLENSTTSLKTSDTVNGIVGSTVIEKAPAIAGYTVLPGTGSQDYKFKVDGTGTITFYYKANEQSNITVNYVDVAHDTEVLKTENPTGHTGETLTLDSESGTNKLPVGYHLAGESELGSHNQSGNMTWTTNAQIMTIYVAGNEVTTTVKYVLNDSTVEISPVRSINGRVGDSVTVTAEAAPAGYSLLSDTTQTKRLTPSDNVIEFNYGFTDPIGKNLTVYQGTTLPDANQAIANYISQTMGGSEAQWLDDNNSPISNPVADELGTKVYQVRVYLRDSDFGGTISDSADISVTIKVIAKPGLTLADQYHPVGGTIEVPQYTDMPQDSTYAQAGITNNSDMPEGTTYTWERHDGQVPDASVAGNNSTGFVRVTFPDDSYKSVKVNVSVEDKITKDIKLKHNAYLYDSTGKRANGITLKAGSIITTYGTKVINGRQFYLLDDENYYLAVGNDKPVTRTLDKNAYTYDAKGKRFGKHVTNQGGEVKTYGIPVLINGKEYYYIGDGQYMKKNNFPPTPEWQEPEMSDEDIAAGYSKHHLIHNAYLYDENGQRSGKLTLKAGSVVEASGIKEIAGKNYYQISDNIYVKAGNVE